jgi:uncharacterized protein involved in exopolysaccharide biosynthesis
MMPSESQSISPRDIARTLNQHRAWWIVPAVVGFVVAAIYSVVTPRQWQATQAVLIRPSVAGLNEERLGKFSDLSEMKTLQETLLEVARSKTVITATLGELGPLPSWFGAGDFPTAQDIVDFRESLMMNPPGGAEFGKTEVFYLGFKDRDPERAARCVNILRQQLESRLKEIRDQRAQSMTAELLNGVDQAQLALNAQVAELADFEATIGDNLADLRSIESPLGGSSQLAQEVLALEAEIRQIDEARIRYEQLQAALAAAEVDATQIVALPASLIASQPALERIKQGLIEAQLKTARLASTRQSEHPLVKAAALAEAEVRSQLHAELKTAQRGVELEMSQATARDQLLNRKLSVLRSKLAALADKRAPYSQQLAAVEHHTRLVEAAHKRLSDAQASRAGAHSSSLLAKIDDVESGVRPVGPGRATIAFAGGLAGLLGGLAVTFVVFGPDSQATRAGTEARSDWSDVTRFDFHPPVSCSKSARDSNWGAVPPTTVADAFAGASSY